MHGFRVRSSRHIPHLPPNWYQDEQPDRASIDLFILHEGTVVEVVTDFGDWNEILLSDGSKGWIRGEQIKRVSFRSDE